jgi:hypothetical protein
MSEVLKRPPKGIYVPPGRKRLENQTTPEKKQIPNVSPVSQIDSNSSNTDTNSHNNSTNQLSEKPNQIQATQSEIESTPPSLAPEKKEENEKATISSLIEEENENSEVEKVVEDKAKEEQS